jgi:hypothetical protein
MRALVAGVGAVLATVLIAAAATARPAVTVSCPLHAGTPSGGDVQWGFTVTGTPSTRHSGLRATYTHGRGNWTSGRATGKACVQDTPFQGAVRDLVMSVSGRSKLSPHVHENGYFGVRIALPVRVSASDDPACPAGSRGTITLFASYYAVHRDSLKLHFGPHCTGHNLSYSWQHLHVLITRHGAQVNTP